MQKAIEVLENKIKRQLAWKESLSEDKEEDLSDYNKQIDETVAVLQTAINHLQRKVKKDPRVDGLPKFGTPHFVWDIYDEVHIYDHHYEEKGVMWWHCLNGRKFTTDEILFYADPNEIL